MAPDQLLVTGCYRSGTTLLEKLLHAQPSVCVASQAFPVLFFMAKEAFLASRNLQRRYPLDHLFQEEGYTYDEWTGFLNEYCLTARDMTELFDRLANYTDGLWTPQVLALRDVVAPGTFRQVLGELLQQTAELLGAGTPAMIGDKEILCEEFIPFLVDHNIKVIVSVRDPRDMITSLDYRVRDNLTGAQRPLLYSLRVWRKSVAYCLAYEGTTNFHWLRYEDIVHNPEEQLRNLATFLAIDDGTLPASSIVSQDGKPWLGNSSFSDQQGISTQSVGRFQQHLPPATRDYVEAVCWPEMAALGYPRHGRTALDDATVRTLQEPRSEMHAKFASDYSYASHRIEAEKRRIAMLVDPQAHVPPAEQRKWYLFERAYERLRHAAQRV